MSKTKKKRPVYVLDTNVLLYNPRAIYAFPDADVVIPDIVLGELDKVKTSRADRELRYRSREISRILFELSANGKLTDGIPFGKNSIVRVESFDPSKDRPESFGTKNSDDRILSIVYQIKQESNGRPVTIVTNDLNMLLKAQTLGVKVEHPGEEFAYSGVKRALFKVRAKKKAVTTALAAVAAIALFMWGAQQLPGYLGKQQTGAIPEGPTQLREAFQDYQNRVEAINLQIDTYEAVLKKNPKDMDALVGIGDSYFDLGNISQDPKNYQKAVDYYKRALAVNPNNPSVRTDMAVAYYNLGTNDLAVRELQRVIQQDDKFYQAHFNLGVIFYQGYNNPKAAREEFVKAKELAPPTSRFALQSDQFIRQIDEEQKAHEKGR